MSTFVYIFQGKNHTDTSPEYFANIGMSDEQIESVLQQQQFEENKTTAHEREWRDNELARADEELGKIQDGAAGTVGEWRDYRNLLRDLPTHADFPNSSARPCAPDSD